MLFKKWLSAATAAGVAETVTQPLEVTKVRMQLQTTQEKRMIIVVRDIVKKEGISALFKGNGCGCLRQALCGGVGVGLYRPMRAWISNDERESSFLQKVAAAASTGVLGQCLAAPTDVVKVRLQADGRLILQGQPPRYTGMLDAFRRIPAEEGFVTFYRGLSPSLGRAAIMYGTSAATYDEFKSSVLVGYLGMHRGALPTHLCASIASGFVAALVSTPFDVVKTRLMDASGPSTYKGPIDCILKTWKLEGVRGFFKGFTPIYARLAPHQLVMFSVLEALSSLLTGDSFV